jgi:hypothetical protein
MCDETSLFFINSHFAGKHSESRMSKQINWFQNATLRSVDNAAQFFHYRAGKPFKIYYVLHLSGSYARRPLPNVEWSHQYKHVSIIYTRMPEDNIRIEDIVKTYNSTVSFTRLDADDIIALDFFLQLDTIKRFQNKTDVILSGPDTLDMINIGLLENGNFYCDYELIRRNMIMSIGQTVTLDAAVWLAYMPGRTMFGDHSKVISFLQNIFNGHGVQFDLHEIRMQQVVGLYVKTDLSSHHVGNTGSARLPCNRKYIAARTGFDYSEILFTPSLISAIPELTDEERAENMNTQLSKKKAANRLQTAKQENTKSNNIMRY